MLYFTRDDLQHTNYLWDSQENHDELNQRGFPSNKPFARTEGREMVSFINALARSNNWNPSDKSLGHRAERLIKQHLPHGVRGTADIRNWLAELWNK